MPALWVPLALAAGLFQSARNALARSLSGEVSPTLNSWSRFAFNLPFSLLLFLTLVRIHGVPETSPRYYLLCFGTGVTQLLGNVCLVSAFRRTNFANAIVLHKLEILFTALIGAALFSEIPTPLGWLGIVGCAAGVILMQLALVSDRARIFHLDSGSALAILSGIFLVLTAFLLKDATTLLAELNPRVGAGRFEVAGHTLFHVTWMEVVVLTVWLKLFLPGDLSLVRVHWRHMMLIGVTGFLGSLGWFWAYSLTLVAYVKAVGQVEAIAAVFLSLLLWHEHEVRRQIPGIVLVILGIVLVLLG